MMLLPSCIFVASVLGFCFFEPGYPRAGLLCDRIAVKSAVRAPSVKRSWLFDFGINPLSPTSSSSSLLLPLRNLQVINGISQL